MSDQGLSLYEKEAGCLRFASATKRFNARCHLSPGPTPSHACPAQAQPCAGNEVFRRLKPAYSCRKTQGAQPTRVVAASSHSRQRGLRSGALRASRRARWGRVLFHNRRGLLRDSGCRQVVLHFGPTSAKRLGRAQGGGRNQVRTRRIAEEGAGRADASSARAALRSLGQGWYNNTNGEPEEVGI